MSRRDEGLPYDLRCEEYKVFRHQSRDNLCKFLEEQQQEVWPVNERTLPAELPKYVWNGEAIAEHNCTSGCLPQRHSSSNSSSISAIMRVVDDVKDNELNDFYFYYSCSIFGAVCNCNFASDTTMIF